MSRKSARLPSSSFFSFSFLSVRASTALLFLSHREDHAGKHDESIRRGACKWQRSENLDFLVEYVARTNESTAECNLNVNWFIVSWCMSVIQSMKLSLLYNWEEERIKFRNKLLHKVSFSLWKTCSLPLAVSSSSTLTSILLTFLLRRLTIRNSWKTNSLWDWKMQVFRR